MLIPNSKLFCPLLSTFDPFLASESKKTVQNMLINFGKVKGFKISSIDQRFIHHAMYGRSSPDMHFQSTERIRLLVSKNGWF